MAYIFFSIKLIIYNFEKVGSFQLYLYLKGLSKECVDVLFEFLKTKAKSLRMWNGVARVKKRKQLKKKMSKQYLKVLIHLPFKNTVFLKWIL